MSLIVNDTLPFNAVELGDLNNDGLIDLAAGYDGQGIFLWLKNPNGTLTRVATPPATIGNYNDISIGDINNDGKPDIASSRQGGISVWFGDGSGTTWGASVGPTTTGTFNGLALDDVNSDGNLDLLAVATGTTTRKGVQVQLGNGAGTWTAGDTNLPVNVKYNGIDSGDFNNDGKVDIVAAGDSGVDAWTGNGAGTWTLSDSGLPSSGQYTDAELADFDHDGCLDLVASGSNNNGMLVWEGSGAGVWTIRNLPASSGTYTAVDVCDANLDGYPDILTSSSSSNNTVWTGDSAFNWYLQSTGLPAGLYHSDIWAGDTDYDGRFELWMANTGGGIEQWHSTVERTTNMWTPYSAPSATGFAVNDIAVADLNLDGKSDICYATQASGIQIWTGNGAGTWATMPSPVTTGAAYGIVVTDFNYDGKPDIIATQGTGVRTWRGNGAGTWTLTANVASTGVWYGLAAADFNDDGKVDIAAGSGANAGLFVWNGNGAGTWAQTFNLPLTGTYYDLDSADANLDGAIDIIAADGGVRVFLGNANDGWTESSTGLPGSSSLYRTVKHGNFDNDGDPDICAGSESMGTRVWNRQPSGQWSEASVASSTHGSGLAASDFNLDGELDVGTGSTSGTGLSAISHGSGWSQVSDGLSTAGNFASTQFADVNIDGRPDIITYNNSIQAARIWVGDYVAPPTPTFSIGPLNVGWNLVSTPLIPDNTAMPGALQDLDGDTVWTVAKYYDAQSINNPWKSYSALGTQSLTNIHECTGVWLYVPNASSLGDGMIRLEGTQPTTTAIPLYTGWNLVGYPSSAARVASATLPPQADMVSVYQSVSPYVLDHSDLSSVTMLAGQGYWVRVTADCTWNIDY